MDTQKGTTAPDRTALPIAVFDSGVGGISVLRQLMALMPGERYLYFGDSANAPYGVRPEAEVRRLTLNAAEKLVGQGIKALVVACNTATAAGVELLRQTWPELIIVGVEPAVKVDIFRMPPMPMGPPMMSLPPSSRLVLSVSMLRCRPFSSTPT